MTASLDTFTSLEALLLFQALAAYGAYSDVFDRISESLKASYLTVDAHNEDPDRFRPDVIRDFCLELLNENARQNSAGEEDGAQVNGDGSRSPKKRKIGSPKLKTIEDASREGRLIPETVAKLYAKYQQQAVEEIKRYERNYEALLAAGRSMDLTNGEGAQQTRVLQAGFDSDEEEQVGKLANTEEVPKINVQEPAAVQTPDLVEKPTVKDVESQNKDPLSISGDSLAAATSPTNVKIDPASKSIDTVEKRPSPSPRPSPTPLPQSGRSSQPQSAEPPDQAKKPHPPPLAPAASSSYSQGTTSRSPSVGQGSSDPARAQHVPPQAHLPPYRNTPPYAASPSSIPAQQHPPPQNRGTVPLTDPYAAARYGVPPQRQQQSNFPHQPGPYPDAAATASHHQAPHYPPRAYPFAANQPPYGQSPGRYQYSSQSPVHSYPPAPPPKGGIQLPPFQITPQAPVAQPSQRQSTTPRPLQPRVVASQASPAVSTAHTPTSTQSPGGPVAAFRNREKTGHKLSPGSQTAFKINVPRATSGNFQALRPREVSPITDDVLEPDIKPAATKRTKPKPPPVKTGRSIRAVSKTPSATATSSRDRTRSQSANSETEDAPALSTRRATRRTKADPATPAITADDDASDSAPPTTIVRVGRPVAKRKRADSTLDKDDLAPSSPISPPTIRQPAPRLHDAGIVFAQKNFNKVSAAIMNTIMTHKHASIFQNPVKDREAPGYSRIIKRPTDLKAIKNAITAGSRAVNALTSSNDPSVGSPAPTPGAPTPGGSGATGSSSSATIAALPWSEDIVPPKGIVNSAQLECELMRIFANAVMFNHPGDPVITDTVEMGDEVMQMVATWRAGGGSGEDGGLEGDEGAATPVGKKRRV